MLETSASRKLSAQFEIVDASVGVPVARALVMSMQSNLLVSSERGRVRRDQDLLARQPVARIHDQVANGPCLIIDKEVLDVADFAVCGFHVMAAHVMGAAQVGISVLLRRFARLGSRARLLRIAPVHRRAEEDRAPWQIGADRGGK